jgi:hypothetical protein
VEQLNPAKPGEAWSMWAVGLYYNRSRGVKSGEPSPPGITAEDLGIRYDFGYALPPQRPDFVSGQPPPTKAASAAAR